MPLILYVDFVRSACGFRRCFFIYIAKMSYSITHLIKLYHFYNYMSILVVKNAILIDRVIVG